ncbi:MAG TPA: HBL/NHE enterotoxin family protein [Thermoanaerobaculia bacterium]|nr:HBL/NHE enterotoxin family protein [Thermoanaerobaculia bacterium]
MSANLRLVSLNGEDVSVDVKAAQEQMADQLDSLSVVTSYSHAILNTHINPVISPPESWFSAVNSDLNTAKTHAMTWISDIAPKIGSTIPQTIINYNTDFMEASKAILLILGDEKKTLSEQEKKDVISLIESVLESITDQRSAVDKVQKSIITLATDFHADHERLVNGKDSAANAVSLAKSESAGIEGKIGELQTKLAEARMKVTVSGCALGLAIFLAVAAFALAAVTGGAGLIVAGAVGVVGVGVAATFTGIFSAEITQLLREISEQQSALDAKKRQVTALQGIVDTVTSLKSQNERAKTALSSVQTMWNSLYDKIDAVYNDLKRGKTTTSDAVRRMKMGAAVTGWQDTADWAKRIQALAAGTSVQPVIQHDTIRLAYR